MFQSWNDEIGRRVIGQRADAEQMRGERKEVGPAVRVADGMGHPQRDELRFYDQTGRSFMDEGTLDGMMV